MRRRFLRRHSSDENSVLRLLVCIPYLVTTQILILKKATG